MSLPPDRPHELQWQVFRGSEAIRRGLLTPDQLRAKSWIRLRHDVYADARLDRDHALACRAARLRLPPTAVIAGPSAAYLDGVEFAATFSNDVHVIAPPEVGIATLIGVRVHRTVLRPGDLAREPRPPDPLLGAAGTRRDGEHSLVGQARTSPLRTAWDLAQWLDLTQAVSIMDALLGGALLDQAELGKLVAERRPCRGWRRADRAFGLADGKAQSPPESILRVRLVMAGLPQPVAQHAVNRGGVIYHPDLSWPQFKVAVEYDGQWHGTADQLHRDRRRLNQLVSAGWIVLHVTSERLRRDFNGVLAEIRAALRSRGWRR